MACWAAFRSWGVSPCPGPGGIGRGDPGTGKANVSQGVAGDDSLAGAEATQTMGCAKATAQVFVRRAEEKIRRLVIRKQTYSEGVN